MQLLNPLALAAATLSIPILILYMLRLRRREIPVSSILLWQRLVRDREANTPWQRLRRNLLLVAFYLVIMVVIVRQEGPTLLDRRPHVTGNSDEFLVQFRNQRRRIDAGG